MTVVILPSLGSGSKTGGPKCWERCLGRSYYNCSNQNGKMDMKRSSIFVSSFSFFCLVVVFQKKNYFTSSDPHHDMLGGGCQVRVVIENMMGRMENLRTLISGFLGLVILVRWALVTMFLS